MKAIDNLTACASAGDALEFFERESGPYHPDDTAAVITTLALRSAKLEPQ